MSVSGIVNIGGVVRNLTGEGYVNINGVLKPFATGKFNIGGVLVDGVPVVSAILNDNSWKVIRGISDAGQAANYWNVGDRKAVALSGTVGSLSLSGTYYCYIIGFDHNSSREGSNRIHFQFGYTALSGGVHIAFVDSAYNTSMESGTWFNMNNSVNTADCWNSCAMRRNIMPMFKSAMPSELQSVLKTVTKYTYDGSGVTSTTDGVFLLAEYEIFGATTYAIGDEYAYQNQYAYYSAGNSALKYAHSSTNLAVSCWLRSLQYYRWGRFCSVYKDGTSGWASSIISYGLAPAFCV